MFTLALGLTIPYSLGILVWNFYQSFVTVSIEFWLIFEPHIRPTRLAKKVLIHHCNAQRKVCLCVKLFNYFRGWILIRLTWNLSRFVQNSVEILRWNFRKKIFPENFSKILCKPRLYRNLWNSGLFSEISFRVRILLKKFIQVLSYVVCTQVRRHVHKQITKEDTGKNSQDVLFSENQFCSLSVWDVLRLTTWVFWSEIFTRHLSLCLLSFGWDLSPWFVPQDWE